jgi:hypothetical protein
VRTDRITLKKEQKKKLKREILIEDERRINKGRKDLNRSQDVAGVTVIWNSPAPLPLVDVDVVVREVDEEDKTAADVGMS